MVLVERHLVTLHFKPSYLAFMSSLLTLNKLFITH